MNNGRPTLKELLDDTKCKHCGQTFHSVRVPLIGQQAKQFMEFNLKLQAHLREKHPEVMAAMAVFAGQFTGLLLLNQFQMADPQLNKEQDITRHKIFKLCTRARVSDETIEQKVKALALEAPGLLDHTAITVQEAIGLIKEFRDVMSEALLYPEPSPIIELTPERDDVRNEERKPN